jgi:hypothetical protein
VGSILLQEGEIVQPGEAVVVLLENRPWVRARISPADASIISAHQAVEILLPSGERFDGEVQRTQLLASTVEANLPDAAASVSKSGASPALLTDIALWSLTHEGAAKLVTGAPCQVRLHRSWSQIVAGIRRTLW